MLSAGIRLGSARAGEHRPAARLRRHPPCLGRRRGPSRRATLSPPGPRPARPRRRRARSRADHLRRLRGATCSTRSPERFALVRLLARRPRRAAGGARRARPRASGWCSCRRPPASRTPASASGAARADERLAEELETTPYEQFIERWRAQPLFARRARRRGASSARGPAPQQPRVARARAARHRARARWTPLWGRLGELHDAGRRRGRRARPEVPRDRRPVGRADPARESCGCSTAATRWPLESRRRCRRARGGAGRGRGRPPGRSPRMRLAGAWRRPRPSPGPSGARSLRPAGSGSSRSSNSASVASPQCASGPLDEQGGGGVHGAPPCRRARRGSRSRYTSAPAAPAPARRPRAAPLIPPQREIFRHTASATPAPSAPGSAAVSSIATRACTASRTRRTFSQAVGRAPRRARGRPARASRSRRPPRATLHAPLASTRSPTAGPTAARTAASLPASSPTPTLTLTTPKPARGRLRRPARRRPRGPSAVTVALTGTLRAGLVAQELRHRASRPPARLVPQRQVDGGERRGQVVDRAASRQQLRRLADARAPSSSGR